MTVHTPGVCAAALAVSVALLVVASCGRTPSGSSAPGPRSPGPAAESAGARPSPATAAAIDPRWAGLAVEVREIVRVSQHVVELHLVVVNTGAADVDLAARLAAGPGGENPFSSAALAEPDGRKRYFVLRDGQDRPLRSAPDGIVVPGEAHPVWVRFPSPSGGAVDVLLPGLPPIRGIPVPPAG